MVTFLLLHPRMTHEHLGMLPEFLNSGSSLTAAEQIDGKYQHGGGWTPMPGWERDHDTGNMRYGDEPALIAIARLRLRDELVEVYRYSWVCISQPDGSFEMARID